MKLSVSAFRAQATAQRKILKPYQNQLNYGACSSFPASGIKVDEVPHMMVDKTGMGTTRAQKPGVRSQSSENSTASSQDEADGDTTMVDGDKDGFEPGMHRSGAEESSATSEKMTAGPRTKSNQRWMKLRTTVQLSGAISNSIQKSKPTLKREDSFLKRFSTRQIPEAQETVDTGDETEAAEGANAQDEVSRRRRKRRKELSRTVINPDENFYFYWLMTVTFCVLYNLWTLIVRQSFPELQKGWETFWYACDGFTDVVFVFDFVVQLRTGYLEQGLMVYDSKKLAGHYLRSRAFTLDLISMLPLDLLQMEIGINPMLRFPRFLKIYRVYNYYYMVESRTVYPNLWRVMNLIHILLILAHWFGCFYYLLSEAEGFRGAWVYPYRQGDDATLARKYLGSLYWSTLTLTTIGDLPTPETNAEYIFTIVSYLIGVFIFATIVGQVGNVITNRNANRLEFERLLDGAKTYMRHHKVPGGMKRRVLRWYDYSWSRGRIQGGGDINTALGLLPDKLKTELALHVNLSVLKKVTIFQECQPEFLHDLVLKMKAYIFTPGDLICRKGEIAREMFIIADGILDVISETGRVLTTMKAGDFFGEIGILNLDGLNKRTADVRSVGYSELFSLSREDVLTAMKDYPEAQEILQNLGRKRLMEAKNASKVHKSQAGKFKDVDSSGESERAGKRIVEKLRSDVKGLKNVLRRSRKETSNGEFEDSDCPAKLYSKKQSILRRMSHVQSSEEYEASNELHTPIGVGLPLLQRLRLLKEKQEKEKEERNKRILVTPMEDELESADTTGEVPPPNCKNSKFNDTHTGDSNSIAIKIRQGRVLDLTKVASPCDVPLPAAPAAPSSGGFEPLSRTKVELTQGGQRDLNSADINGNCSLTSVKSAPLDENETAAAEDVEIAKEGTFPCEQQMSVEPCLNVTKASGHILHSVPTGALGNQIEEVPNNNNNGHRGVFKPLPGNKEFHVKNDPWTAGRGPYLSKSDPLLEKQISPDMGFEKRSRSMSPSEESTVALLQYTSPRRTGDSLKPETEEVIISVPDNREMLPKSTDSRSGFRIKKYNSIDDLSPEFSGLPFVKKLKILNERQKLAELVEQELVIRSASLDVPETPRVARESLIRSRSIASSIELQRDHKRRGSQKKGGSLFERPRLGDSFRAAMAGMQRKFIITGSNASLQSPESNETLERRHLKSILKKLSGDGPVTSDNDRHSRNGNCFIRGGREEIKKLMRSPTVEGYAARHTKLTKSVTFNRDTLQSPTDISGDESYVQEQPQTRGFFPAQSNMKETPTSVPKSVETDPDCYNVESTPGQVLSVETVRHTVIGNEDNAEVDNYSKATLLVYSYQEAMKIFQGHLDVIHCHLRSQFLTFEKELKKRDEAIQKLKFKIEKLERRESYEDMLLNNDKLMADSFFPLSGNGEHLPEDSTPFSCEGFNGCPLLTSESSESGKSGSTVVLDGAPTKCGKSDSEDGDAKIHGVMSPLSRNALVSDVEEVELSELNKKPQAVEATKDVREDKKQPSLRSKGGLIHRVAELRRSVSRANDFISLDIESSHSSDPEDLHSNDWELKMLAEEMSKNENICRWMENEQSQLEEMRRLERDVNALKKVVGEGDLTCFSASELDMLETILEAKDRKISEIASNSCFDITVQEEAKPKGPESHITSRRGEFKRKSPRRYRIGQALSFDFHDIDDSGTKSVLQRKCTAKRQKTISGLHQERQSLDNILQATSLLANQVLGESKCLCKNLSSSNSNGCRSSLPIIMSHSLTLSKNVRTSLPTLLRKQTCDKPRLNEYFVSFGRSSDSISPQNSAKGSFDPMFKKNESKVENMKSPSKDGKFEEEKSSDDTFNNFMIVVQNAEQTASDIENLMDQPPSISMSTEEQPILPTEPTHSPNVSIPAVKGQTNSSESVDSAASSSKTDSPAL